MDTERLVRIMNTFWLKLAGAAVAVVVLIVLVSVLNSSGGGLDKEPEIKEKPKTFYDVAEKDDRRLRADPVPKGWTPTEDNEEPPVPDFRKLDEIETMEAERLFNVAIQHRKIGRLPGPSYKQMIDYCRDIIERFPDTIYAFKARRMLGDIPARYQEQFNITEEETDLGDWQ